MTTLQLQRYAHLLAQYCLQVKQGQHVLIRTTPLAEPLLDVLYSVLLRAGATVEFLLSFRNQDRLYYENVADDRLADIGPFASRIYTDYDAILTIEAPFSSRDIAHIPDYKKSRRQAAMAPLKKTFMHRSASGDLRWALCVFPTSALAGDAGMSLASYTRFVAAACLLDAPNPKAAWEDLRHAQQAVVDRLHSVRTLHIIGPQTDLTVNVAGRTWINSDGQRNMPSGEVFTSPVETGINGTILFDIPTRYHGKRVRDVFFRVENGRIVSWKAKVGQHVLDNVLTVPGADHFGEVAFGLNHQIQTPTLNILFDEKIGGTMHMAIGASYPETGGQNHSAVHWDLIKDMSAAQVWADGQKIYEKGAFI